MNDQSRDELVLAISDSIKHHRILEVNDYATNLAVGIANVEFNLNPLKIWLVNNENHGSISLSKDFVGNPIVTTGHRSTVVLDGKVVHKNSKIGAVLIRNNHGKHLIDAKGQGYELKIKNTCFYIPHKHISEALDLKFNLSPKRSLTYNSLNEIFKIIRDKSNQIERLEKGLNEIKKKEEEDLLQQQQYEDRIEKLKKETAEAKIKARSFIRVAAALRYQPILDPWQDEVIRTILYDGTMAINGGPGTGKTTTLIQRIKFLIDKIAIEEYLPDLSRDKKEKILNNDNNWIFFSPNELLKLYLKNNMVEEGLKANNERVAIWSEYKEMLVRKYKIVNTDTQNPFLFLRNNKDENLMPIDGKELKKAIAAFDYYYLTELNNSLQQLIAINCDQFFWKEKAKSVQSFINRQEKDYTLDGLIRLYFNIEENYKAEVKVYSTDFNDLLKKATAFLISKINTDVLLMMDIEELTTKWLNDIKQVDDDDQEEEDEEISENPDETNEEVNNYNLELYIYQKFRTLIRKVALMQFDKKVKLTKKEQLLKGLSDRCIEISVIDNINKIGELAYFIKYFEKSTRGVVSNLFQPIPNLYKQFRKQIVLNGSKLWNVELLNKIINSDEPKNKRLHPNEQAFLIYFLNQLIKKCYKISKPKTKSLRHSYIDAYHAFSRPVIGVDEATDFHLIDLLAISSLSDFEISSVTYSGDLMQRLTENGLRSWDDLKLFDSTFQVKELAVSYRQSPTLLTLAEKIYEKATGNKAEYISHMELSDDEPKPLLFINTDEQEKIKWIAERIVEIHTAYGDLKPSIAIFLQNESEIEQFSNQLAEVDRLANVGLRVKACNKGQVLGDENMIRVFSLEYIKGLEFQAVFFHNIQDALAQSNQEMVLKNIYVGLSRAAFYLGITASEKPTDLIYLDELFTEKVDWR